MLKAFFFSTKLKVSQASRVMWSMEETVRHAAKTKASGTADKWLVGAGETRQRVTLLDQLGPVNAKASGSTSLFSTPCAPHISVTLASLSPSLLPLYRLLNSFS